MGNSSRRDYYGRPEVKELPVEPWTEEPFNAQEFSEAIKHLVYVHRDVNPFFNARYSQTELNTLPPKQKSATIERLLPLFLQSESTLVATPILPFFEASTKFLSITNKIHRNKILPLFRRMYLSPAYFLELVPDSDSSSSSSSTISSTTSTSSTPSPSSMNIPRISTTSERYNVNCFLISSMGFMCFIALILHTREFKARSKDFYEGVLLDIKMQRQLYPHSHPEQDRGAVVAGLPKSKESGEVNLDEDEYDRSLAFLKNLRSDESSFLFGLSYSTIAIIASYTFQPPVPLGLYDWVFRDGFGINSIFNFISAMHNEWSYCTHYYLSGTSRYVNHVSIKER